MKSISKSLLIRRIIHDMIIKMLISLHAQHEQRTLLKTSKHLELVDTYDESVKELKADSIVSAIGFVPDQTLADKSNPHVHVIGDANFVSNLKGAVWYANDLAIALSN